MLLRYRYRCQPTPGQRIALAQAFGCARVVWNDALALSQEFYRQGEKYPGGTALMQRCITQAKRTPERSWLGDVSASMLQQSVRDLDKAFRNWWNGKGKVRAPRFKRRSNAQSIRICGKESRTTDHGVRFPKVGDLKLRWSRDLPAPPTSLTIIKDTRGRYYASFVVEVERPKLQANSKAVGLDLGLTSLAVTSDGEKISPPRFLRSALKRLRRLQRNLKGKVKGSNRLAKAKRRVARLHGKIADRRLDVLHKLSTRLIRENQTVVVEDLNVSGLSKNRKMARSIADAGWRLLRGLLEYKAELHGRALRVISRWEPTSQRCSACGDRGCKKELAVRSWTCPACGTEHDRDVNAAKNILAAGLAARLNGRGAESKTGVPASASTRLDREVCYAS
ncbi:MAG: IS200/IS605 family element transposase accessory protein TnpB [Synechococcus sp. SB0668_bin_13]|nr:IS200/IS605 family element transposase accessory protein TnpB [Synechococcus sp. SB0668_bin_13]